MPEKKSRFLLELNEMPNRGGRVATDFVRLFNFQCIKTTFSRSSTAQLIYPRSHSNLRTQAAFFADLSVSKTHFTDKPAFSNDLSVNFWQL